MQKTYSQHFSKKIFLFSLLFLALNLLFFKFLLLNQVSYTYRSVAPQIHFEEPSNVQIKSLYSQDYYAAQLNQEWMVGGTLRTDENGTAEVILENNLIRLGEGTELKLIENNFSDYQSYTPAAPRLVFELKQGSVWVNAFDKIRVDTPLAQNTFFHSVGSVVYNQPLNRVMAFTGTVDIDLYDLDQNFVAQFPLPLNNQVIYTDEQIIPEYASLRYSKLKKELKTSPISNELIAHPWVVENIHRDHEYFFSKIQIIDVPFSYWAKNLQLNVRSYLTFAPEARRDIDMERAELILGYILSGPHSTQKTDKIEPLLVDLQDLIDQRHQDSMFQSLLTQAFLVVSQASVETDYYSVREFLLSYLLEVEGVEMLRTYLGDLHYQIDSFDLKNAEMIANRWLNEWKTRLNQDTLREFTRQAEEVHQMLLAYADTITPPLLDLFDQTGEMRLSFQDQIEELRFEVTEDRLSVAAALVNSFRYSLAKQYLADSYLALNIDFLPAGLPTTDIFLQFGKLLAQRIDYAEERLGSEPVPIDEIAFKEYLEQKERDENLRELLEIEADTLFASAPPIELITVEQLVQEMASEGIALLASDVSINPQNSNEFLISSAQFGQGSETKSFKAKYSPLAKAFKDVELEGEPLSGTFALKNFVSALSNYYLQDNLIQEDPSNFDLLEFLDIADEDPSLRDQLFAENLALQLTLTDLNGAGLEIVSEDDIEILDTFSLDQFLVKAAKISLTESDDQPIITFQYNHSTKQALNVSNLESGEMIVEKVDLDQLLDQVITYFERMIQLDQAMVEFNTYADQNNLVFIEESVFLDENGFLSITFSPQFHLDLQIEGLFDLENKTFTSLKHPFYQVENASLNDYLELLLQRYGENFLLQNGVGVPNSVLWSVDEDFEIVSLENYVFEGSVLSFALDFKEGVLRDVYNQTDNSRFSQMTFGEFKEMLNDLGE